MVVLSPSAANSIWLKREVAFALTETRLDDRIIPVVCAACSDSDIDQVSWVLRLIQRIDFSQDFDSASSEFLRQFQEDDIERDSTSS